MRICYNMGCPFNGDKPCECDAAQMCERFTGSPVVVRTSNRTKPAEQSYSSTSNRLSEDKDRG